MDKLLQTRLILASLNCPIAAVAIFYEALRECAQRHAEVRFEPIHLLA
jgi:hypothetical protein